MGKLKNALDKIEEKEYLVTKPKLVRWFDIINQEVFNGVLPKLEFKITDTPYTDLEFKSKKFSDIRASYVIEDVDTPQEYMYIVIKKRLVSEQLFLKVLVHEMVHHFTWINERVINHGPVFKKWVKILKQHNCPLQYIYQDRGENGKV